MADHGGCTVSPSLQLGETGAGAGEVSDLLVAMKQGTTGKTE